MRFAKALVGLSIVLLCVAFLPGVVFGQGDAAAAISSAKQQLVVCYDAARRAESAGANVSYLAAVLSSAGDLLSRAELAYAQGDFGGAQNLASQCSGSLSSFVSVAESARAGAAANEGWVGGVVVASVVGVVIVILSGFLVWRYIRKQYLPVEMDAEVESHESS